MNTGNAHELRNLLPREVLQARLDAETEPRTTLSFYRYAHITDPRAFRDQCYERWSGLGVLGRIYIATEGINGQLSVPASRLEDFREVLHHVPFLAGTRLNIAIEAQEKSFLKLIIKVRPKIVADGLHDETFDVTKRGRHLDARKVNALLDRKDTIVVDMRNHYESEVGYFRGAILPEATNFRDLLPEVEEILADKKDREIVMYCTGGIRCEKASAYYLHRGFERVSMVDGGIIEYARQCEREGLEKKYIGKNFVFDDRLGERITDDVVARCHQCGKVSDRQLDCANTACHVLFLQCEECSTEYDRCCSVECQAFNELPVEERARLAPTRTFNGERFGKAMRRPVSALLLLLTFLLLGSCARRPATPAADEAALSVMSYNIRLDNRDDGDDAWPERRDFFASQVLYHAPDILGTQEVLPRQLDWLKDHLREYGVLGVGREGRNKGEYSALFYRRDRLMVEESGTFWLSTTPDEVSVGWDAALPRICTYGRFRDLRTGKDFMAFNTHFDHVGEVARRESARLLLRKIDSLNTGNLPFVLTGDLNLTPDTEPIAVFTESLVDAYTVAPVRLGPAGTFTGFNYDEPAERRIDYIMVSPGVQVDKFATLTDAVNRRYPSDHFAVVASLHLRPRR